MIRVFSTHVLQSSRMSILTGIVGKSADGGDIVKFLGAKGETVLRSVTLKVVFSCVCLNLEVSDRLFRGGKLHGRLERKRLVI